MQVFLSYPAADRKLAERLREELSGDGLSISAFDARERAGVEWRKQVEATIRSADDILILVGPGSNPDEAQQLEWRAALQAVWQDSHKRLIPVLVRDAALPPFVFENASSNDTQVVRIVDPADVRGAAQAIRGVLRRKDRPPGDEPPVKSKGTYSYPVEVERNSLDVARQERIQELKKLAERLRD